MSNRLINLLYTNAEIEYFKSYFKEEIGSIRTYARIRSISELEKILIKRDCNLKIFYDKLKNLRNNTDVRQQVLPNIPTEPIARIDQLISNEIGVKWKDLARNLQIPEGKIDEFSQSYPRIEEIIKEILQYHRNNEPHYWKTKLCEALRKIRRNDLWYKVNQIFESAGML